MNLLDGKIYDPAVAVSKATTALLALTALDTTNLRLTVTVPPSGKIYWRIKGALHGATTYPQIILGILEGANVRARVAAMLGGNNLAATSICAAWGEGLITGLTPGASFVADAAYGVETVVAATGFKYGGPNNTTGNDNFGGCVFELWDPQPIYTGSAAPTSTVHVKLDAIDDFVDTEIGDIRNRLPAALVGGRMDSSVGAMASGVITAAAHAAGAIDAAALAADAGSEIATAVWASGTRVLTANTNLNDLNAAGVRAAVGLASANLDTQLGAIAGYIDTEVAAVLAAVDTEVGAIKAKTDQLAFTVAGHLDVNVLVINGVTVGGAGTSGSPWGPA